MASKTDHGNQTGKVGVTISAEAWSRLTLLAARRGITKTATLERMILEAPLPEPIKSKPADTAADKATELYRSCGGDTRLAHQTYLMELRKRHPGYKTTEGPETEPGGKYYKVRLQHNAFRAKLSRLKKSGR